MKLHATVCLGLIVFFLCDTPQTQTVSEFCQVAGPEIAKLRSLTPAEIAALTTRKTNADARVAIKTLFYAVCEPNREVAACVEQASTIVCRSNRPAATPYVCTRSTRSCTDGMPFGIFVNASFPIFF